MFCLHGIRGTSLPTMPNPGYSLPRTKGSVDPAPAQHTLSTGMVFVSEDIRKPRELLGGLHTYLCLAYVCTTVMYPCIYTSTIPFTPPIKEHHSYTNPQVPPHGPLCLLGPETTSALLPFQGWEVSVLHCSQPS